MRTGPRQITEADRERRRQHAIRLNRDPEMRKRQWLSRRNLAGVPGWVPAELRDEFIEVARLNDEFVAARYVRGLLAELRA
jgi:hypothetical protein